MPDWIMIFLFFSTLMSWAYMTELDTLDYENVTTWLGLILCIPGFLITLLILSPFLILAGIGKPYIS